MKKQLPSLLLIALLATMGLYSLGFTTSSPKPTHTASVSEVGSPFVGEIRMFAGSYAPNGWAFCEGQKLSISEYPELYSVLSNSYGGNGSTDFALPNLKGKTPIHPNPSTGIYTGSEMPAQKAASGNEIPVPGTTGINFIIAISGDYPMR